MDFTALATGLAVVVTGAITASIAVITLKLGAEVGYGIFSRFIKK